MTRYLRRLAPLGGLVAAAVVALSAAPASATVVCPPGVTPPSPYCSNVKPTAVTGVASGVKGTSATLNGAAGASVTGGDPTQWFFKYGTSTAYGKQTPTQTLGIMPARASPSEPVLHDPGDPGGVGERIGADAVYDVSLPDLREQSRHPDARSAVATRRSRRASRSPSRTSRRRRRSSTEKKFKVKFTLNFQREG